MKTKIKLSAKQEQVIRLMRRGAPLTKLTASVILRGGCTQPTFFALLNQKLIEESKNKDTFGVEYVLTKLGKEIILTPNK
jgi:hypothetical protein